MSGRARRAGVKPEHQYSDQQLKKKTQKHKHVCLHIVFKSYRTMLLTRGLLSERVEEMML